MGFVYLGLHHSHSCISETPEIFLEAGLRNPRGLSQTREMLKGTAIIAFVTNARWMQYPF